MTLADILARTSLELHEAVAVMQGLFDLGVGTSSPAVPDLRQIEVRADGHVQVYGGSVVHDPVAWVVEIVTALTYSTVLPSQFALLLEQPPDSVLEFSDALAYYERPNRGRVLEELYRRASGSEATREVDALMDSFAAEQPPPVPENVVPGDRRRRYFAAAVVAALLIATVAVVALMRRGEGRSAMTARLSEGVSGVTAAVGNALASVGERVGLGTAAPAPAAAPPAVEKPELSARASRPAQRERHPIKTGAAAPIPPPPPAIFTDAALAPVPMPPMPPIPQWSPAAGQESPGAPVGALDRDESPVYSAASPGVSPPVSVRPQLPKTLPPGVRPEQAAHIELVIAADGNVTSARLVGQPRTVHDSMLVSAAKAWRFRPALKDGQPVPYRLTILVAR